MIDALRDKATRDRLVWESICTGIASQVRAMRLARGWTQAELARRMGTHQEVISRLEKPETAGRSTLRTLKLVASTFDVALVVRFVSFGNWLAFALTPDGLVPLSFDEECGARTRPGRDGARGILNPS